uniref:Peptidase S1 domain-containing protein n=1 Tax=Sciurus vulgaris TaxID=55149 RepID=A0A8D2ATN0_SCIVU
MRQALWFPALPFLLLLPSSSSDAMLKGYDWGPGALVSEEIIGGMESKPHSRPYMAHLEIITDSGSAANCGGFLISQKFVMTAGDSGGPLLCAGVAHGIVSYGRGNAKPPAIFTHISPYVPWIKKILKGD